MPKVTLSIVAGSSWETEAFYGQTAADLVASARARAFEVEKDARHDGEVLKVLRSVPEMFIFLVKGTRCLTADNPVLDSAEVEIDLVVMTASAEAHPFIAGWQPEPTPWPHRVPGKVIFEGVERSVSKVLDVLITACEKDLSVSDCDCEKKVWSLLAAGDEIRADVVLHLAKSIVEPHEQGMKYAVLVLLGAKFDSALLLTYACDNCSEFPDLVDFGVVGEPWKARPLCPLCVAVRCGSLSAFRMLLSGPAEWSKGLMDGPVSYYVTLLHYAVSLGHVQMVELILSRSQITTAWVLTYRRVSDEGKMYSATVLHIALSMHSQVLAWALCKALLSSRFGKHLIDTPIKYEKFRGQGPKVESTFDLLRQRLRTWQEENPQGVSPWLISTHDPDSKYWKAEMLDLFQPFADFDLRRSKRPATSSQTGVKFRLRGKQARPA
eukprot:TRINITY_DN99834_c0_g1_i1.p1 TRINITY_DN99834_c0_g1~~TRINITY_DN99834_c0_g1_i1.p1  ORF type:complete len:437 (-),score=50.70 TRINITY_DN99834_c0_g1_i1:102-1412(-)